MEEKWLLVAVVLLALVLLRTEATAAADATTERLICGNKVWTCDTKRGEPEVFRPRKRYHIPDWYTARTDAVHYDDIAADPSKARYYQREVYLHVLDMMEQHEGPSAGGTSGRGETSGPPAGGSSAWKRVVDVGTGAGYKLIEILGDYDTIGIETDPAISHLRSRYPDRNWVDSGLPDETFPAEVWDTDVLLCSDVVEHVKDPDILLNYLKRFKYKVLIISTPDRERLRNHPDLKDAYGEKAWKGPPLNLSHFREWTSEEFKLYLADHFTLVSSHIGEAQPECQWHVLIPKVNSNEPETKEEKQMYGVKLVTVQEEEEEESELIKQEL